VYAESLMGNINYETTSTDDITKIVEAGDVDFDFGNITSDNLYHDSKVMNIVLLSLDNYQSGDNGRTDSMMMVSIDTRNEEIKLTSFMRDLYVSIPGYGYSRLNSAYSYGGPALTVATLEDNFRVDIDRYIIIDYKKFVKIIDTIGGVDLEITQEEADVINEESNEDASLALSAGTVHMTGKQARMYARIRKIDSDFERTNRQRKLVAAILEQLKSADLLTLNSYISDILGMITTDMTKDEVLGLAANVMTYLNYDISSFRLPADGEYYDLQVSLGGVPALVLVPYLQENIDLLVEYVYGKDNIPELKSTYTLSQYKSDYDYYNQATRFFGEGNTDSGSYTIADDYTGDYDTGAYNTDYTNTGGYTTDYNTGGTGYYTDNNTTYDNNTNYTYTEPDTTDYNDYDAAVDYDATPDNYDTTGGDTYDVPDNDVTPDTTPDYGGYVDDTTDYNDGTGNVTNDYIADGEGE
jgi:LCP family protein required for cell wall assembly